MFLVVSDNLAQTGFKQTQQTYARLREAYSEKGDSLLALLTRFDIKPGEIELCLRAFKKERLLEVWGRNKGEGSFRNLKSYDICSTSGVLGPKRMQGDYQIPEGFYHISAFNPWSSFHLSMCINYPNPSDRILGVQGNLGGDICIHGSCVTIGCIPLTDEMIKEVYLLCVEARNNGQIQIPVTLFPSRLSTQEFDFLVSTNSSDKAADNVNLWTDLKTAYDYFETNHQLPEITFLDDGRHLLQLKDE